MANRPDKLSPEETAALKPHVDKWVEIARRTGRRTPEQIAATNEGIRAFYPTIGLKPTPPEWIINLRSPMEARIAAGLLAGGWHLHKVVDPKQWTEKRLEELRDFCMNLPMNKKIDMQTFRVRPYAISKITKESGLGEWGMRCVGVASRMWHGGNMSVSSEAFVSFFRDVVKVESRFGVDLTAWNHWEKTVLNAGARFMHEDFVVFSDFPDVLGFDEQDRAHPFQGAGPHARWSDGSALYYWHGVQVPAFVIETPDKLTAKRVMEESNAEVRRVMMERMGLGRFITEAGATVIHEDKDGLGKPRRLLRARVPGDEDLVMVEVTNSTAEPDGTFRLYHMRVNPSEYGGRAGKECLAAIASTWREKKTGLPLMFKTPEEYKLQIET